MDLYNSGITEKKLYLAHVQGDAAAVCGNTFNQGLFLWEGILKRTDVDMTKLLASSVMKTQASPVNLGKKIATFVEQNPLPVKKSKKRKREDEKHEREQ